MHVAIQQLLKILHHSVFVHIYSSPNFMMEACINLFMCVFHCILITEVTEVIKRLNLPPMKIQTKPADSSIKFKDNPQGIVRIHPDLGVEVVFNENNLFGNEWDTTTKINKILSTSVSEYIRSDKKNMKALCDNESDVILEEFGSPASVEKLYNYLIQEPHLKKAEPAKDIEKFERTEVVRLR